MLCSMHRWEGEWGIIFAEYFHWAVSMLVYWNGTMNIVNAITAAVFYVV